MEEEKASPPVLCDYCQEQPFKYKCPACSTKTCSLRCCQAHKAATKCSGKRDPHFREKVKMADFDLGMLRKDLRFIDENIAFSNTKKKDTFNFNNSNKVSKKDKNLRYFLKRHRNITYKVSPASFFKRSEFNSNYLDTSTPEKTVFWSVELQFIKVGAAAEGKTESISVTLHGDNVIPENTKVGSLVNKKFLTSTYFNQEFSLFIHSLEESQLERALVQMQQLVKGKFSKELEEGELDQEEQALKHAFLFKEVQRDQSLRQALAGQMVFEYPTLRVQLI